MGTILATLLIAGCGSDEIHRSQVIVQAEQKMWVLSTTTPVTPCLRLHGRDLVRTSDGTIYYANVDSVLKVSPSGAVKYIPTPNQVFMLTRNERGRVFGMVDSGVIEITSDDKIVLIAGALVDSTTTLLDRPKDHDGDRETARFFTIEQIGADDSGNIYVFNGTTTSATVRKITNDGAVTTLFRGLFIAEKLDNWGWANFAVDAEGNLFFGGTRSIVKRDLAGRLHTIAVVESESESLRDGVATEARVWTVSTVRTDRKGNVYFQDRGGLRKVSAAGEVSSLYSSECSHVDTLSA
ncbi:MAG: hypothetical protein ABUU24_03440, partial [Variovorax sp.]